MEKFSLLLYLFLLFQCNHKIALGSNLGNECVDNHHCNTPRSFCNMEEGYCSCMPGFVADSSNNICYSVRNHVGDPCEISEQCKQGSLGDFSDCIDTGGGEKVCKCLPDSVYDPAAEYHVCLPTSPNLGDDCLIDEQCKTTDSLCSSNGKCVCQDGFVPDESNTRCLRSGQLIGDPCQIDAQCENMLAVCFASICVCPPDFLEASDGTICLKIRHEVGEECRENQQCTHGPLGEMSGCIENICKCLPEAIYNPDLKKCVPNGSELGDECDVNAQCSIENSECRDGICQCLTEFLVGPNNTSCLEIRENLGESCEISAQCTANMGYLSHCSEISKTCSCLPHAVPNVANTFCYPVVDYIGHPCVFQRQCINGVPGSLSDCLEMEGTEVKTCQCKFNAIYDPASGSQRCFERRHYLNETCDVDAQCKVNLGELSHCSVDKICSCLDTVAVANADGSRCESA